MQHYISNATELMKRTVKRHWIWLALDIDTREIVEVWIGDGYFDKLSTSLEVLLRSYSNPYLLCIVKVHCATQISGRLTPKCCQASVTRRWERKQVERAT